MKKRKRRSVAVSSAASRKGWRTRKIMASYKWENVLQAALASEIRTIDRLPKIKWG